MTIKDVKPGVGRAGADPAGRSTDTIIVRLGVMRKRSQQLLHEMEQLEEQFRQHADQTGHPQPPIPPVK
jgi:hypothetical protein